MFHLDYHLEVLRLSLSVNSKSKTQHDDRKTLTMTIFFEIAARAVLIAEHYLSYLHLFYFILVPDKSNKKDYT